MDTLWMADRYEAAAEYLEEYGWTQHTTFENDGRACLTGALSWACGYRKNGGWKDIEKDSKQYYQSQERLEKFMKNKGYYHGMGSGDLTSWNDRQGRQVFEVISVFKDAAKELRHEEV